MFNVNPIYPNLPIRGVIGTTGKEGNKPGKFRFPSSVCFDNIDNKVIISDTDNHRIQLYDSSTLQFYSMFGSSGNQQGQFNNPCGICIQPFTRNLLICDSFNNRIQIFDHNNSYLFSYQFGSKSEKIGQFNKPKGICCDTQGHIIVADTQNHRIQEFNENGRFLHSFGSYGESLDQFNRPWDISFDKEHHQLFITDCDNKRISIWSRDNQPISHIDVGTYCYSVCIDPLRNQILVGTYHNIFVYDKRNYKLIQTLGTDKQGSELGAFSYVSGLCMNEDDDGSLVVADHYNNRVQIF